jgi:hypothetical protein
VSSGPDEDARRGALEDFAWRSQTGSRRARLDEAAAEVSQALCAAGVPVLLLKGAALARMLYRSHEERGYYDVDMLVQRERLPQAAIVMTELGYRNVSADWGVVDVAGILHAEVWHKVVPGFGILPVDLHWRLDGCDAQDDVLWAALSADAGSVTVAGTPVPTLSAAGLALHVALHAAQHGPEDGKAMGDLRRAIERWPVETWRQAARLAEQVAADRTLAAGLRLAPPGVGLADELGLGSGEDVLWELANRGVRPRGTFHLEALAQARTVREQLHVVRQALLPSPAWIRWEVRWAARGRPYLAAAYLVHLSRAPLWALDALRYRRRRRISGGAAR